MAAVEAGNPECAYAISKCGVLYAWGDNSYGKLGLGTTNTSVLTPTVVLIPGQRRVSRVTAGADFALAVCTDGSAWSWGRNDFGQLGIGTTGPDVLSPVQFLSALVVDVRAGQHFGLAMRSTGKVLSWGLDQFGELGRNQLPGTISPTPTPLNTLQGGGAVAIETMGRFAAGVVQADGSVYCWGRNDLLLLGTGGGDEAVPTETLPAGSGAVALAGNELSVIASLSNGQTRVWGINDQGFFGVCNGPYLASTPIVGPMLPSGAKVLCIATDATACITGSGQILYWGEGGLPYTGPGGAGSSTFACTPTPLPNAFPAVANTGPLPAIAPVSVNISTATLCAGSSVVLQASGGDGTTYRWSPNVGLSATTGATVVVAPGQTQTYTVTSSNACGTASATVAVTVKENCCQVDDGYRMTLQGTYNASPFISDPGTRYFGVSNLLFLNDVFKLGVGQTLLMKDGTTLTVANGAELRLEGATITAGCNEMWGGVVVAGSAGGVYTASVGTLPSRIQHARQAVDVAESSRPAIFQLRNTEFLHNQKGVALHRATAGATSQDGVRSCTFDSTPEFFKAPWKKQGPTDYHYTQQHLYLAGNFLPATFRRNKLRHAIFGMVGSSIDGEASNIAFDFGELSDCYLAGAYNFVNPGYRSTWSFEGDEFRFPGGVRLPAIQQIRDYLPLVSSTGTREETYGIWTYNEAAPRVLECNFVAADDAPARQAGNYAEFGRTGPRQVGIQTRNLMSVEGSRFETLETGIDQRAYTGSSSNLVGNVFENCRIGWDILAPGDITTPNPSVPEPVLNATCNTFVRGALPDGTATGIHIQRNRILYSVPTGGYVSRFPTVRIETPNPSPSSVTLVPLKNYFDNAGRSAGEFWAVNNEQGGTPLAYYTYDNYVIPVQPFFTGNFVINPGVSMGPLRNDGQTENITCEFILPYPNVGLQARGTTQSHPPVVVATNTLAQNWPNPCTGSTTFRYTTKVGSLKAELLVRRATDGREVSRQTLNSKAVEATLAVGNWPAGTYFATLVVDGAPGVTRRIVVE